MHQTVYIDVDEEITSILDRVRQENTMDIFLVVPKDAMLLNSIINLKLLKKEAEKMGKTVAIVAPNDNNAKVMIERAGIRAEDYSKTMNEQQLQEASIDRNVNPEQINKAVADSVGETERQIVRNDLDIGSNSFFAKNSQAQIGGISGSISQSNELADSQNQFNNVDNPQSVAPSQQQGVSYQRNGVPESTVTNTAEFAQKENINQGQGEIGGKVAKSNYPEEGNKFDYFNTDKKGAIGADNLNKKTSFGKKLFIMSAILFGIILLGGGGWYLSNYPKLDLAVKPLYKDIDKEIKLIAKGALTSVDVDSKNIPGEYMEISLEKTMEFEATGSKVIDKDGAKSRGVVVIENSFSNKPQRLVKTTRVLSKSGKLFRLSKEVMVPGLKDDTPGKIEVAVEADKPGKDFNIKKEEFVIVAWKGTPKGEKFKVISTGAMTGGITSADSKMQKVVSKTDLDTARKETLKAMDESLEEEIKKRLNPGQQIVQSSVEKEIVSVKASHLENTIAEKFSYTAIYKIKVVAFIQEDVKEVIIATIQKELGKKYKLKEDFKIDIKRGISDLDKKTATIYVDVEGVSLFQIDEAKLKDLVKGKSVEEIKNVLNKNIGVQSAEIKPAPAWSSKAPNNLDKITIEIVN